MRTTITKSFDYSPLDNKKMRSKIKIEVDMKHD